MALTADRYIADQGRVMINSVDQSGSIKEVVPSAPRRSTREILTLGGKATESQDRDKAGNYEITVRALDDRSLAKDETGAVGVLWNAYITNTPLTGFAVAPAGATIGMTEYTYTNVNVVQCPPHSDLDADTEEEALVEIVLTADGVTPAAIIA